MTTTVELQAEARVGPHRRAFCLGAFGAASVAAVAVAGEASAANFRVLVFSGPRPGLEDPFNHWYDSKHLSEMLRMPGFRTGRRLKIVAAETPASTLPAYIADYEVETRDIAAVNAEVGRRMKSGELSRSEAFDYDHSVTLIFEALRGPLFAVDVAGATPAPTAGGRPLQRFEMVVLSSPAAGQEAEYNRWYDAEHLPDVLRNPGFKSARRYRLSSANPAAYVSPGYLVVFELESADIDATRAEVVRRLKSGQTRTSPSFDNTTAQVYVARVLDRT